MNTEKIGLKKKITPAPTALRLKAPIAKYQQGVQDGKTGKWGDRVYYKYPPTKQEDYENITSTNRDIIQSTTEWKSYQSKQKEKPTIVKKAVAGALIGAVAGPVISGITSMIAANKEAKMQRKMELEKQTNNFNQFNEEQNVNNLEFLQNNKNDLPVYEKGGKIKKLKNNYEMALKDKPKYQKEQASIKPYTEESKIKKALDIVSYPFTAASYLAKNQSIPGNFTRGEKNSFDGTLSVFPPMAALRRIHSGKEVVEDLSEGNYKQAAFDAVGLVGSKKIRTKGINLSKTKPLPETKGSLLRNSFLSVNQALETLSGKDFGDWNADNTNKVDKKSKGGIVQNTNTLSTTGNFDTTGGKLNPISSNAQVVDGNKHSEKKIDNSYGVTLSQNGKPIVNVEDEEVIVDNNYVFSDKLKKGNKTFADVAFDINKKVGELETKQKGFLKPHQRFSTERTIQGLKMKNHSLFAEQEMVKKATYGNTQETVEVQNGKVAKGANGVSIKKQEAGGAMQMATTLAPLLIDNVFNAITKKPRVPRPLLNRAPIIDTKVNSNPQLAEITNALKSSTDYIDRNTNNSSVARANITSANLKAAGMKGDVLAKKEQDERTLSNQQKEITYSNSAANNELLNTYAEDVYNNNVQRMNANNKNMVNAVEDIQMARQHIMDKEHEFDDVELELLNDPTGEKSRTILNYKGKINERVRNYANANLNRKKPNRFSALRLQSELLPTRIKD